MKELLQNEQFELMMQKIKDIKTNNEKLTDFYDGSVFRKYINSNEMKDVDTPIFISACYDGLDVYRSGNKTGDNN